MLNKELTFETFKYFLECYFNMSADYSELEKVIAEFNSFEDIKNRKKLRAELEEILKLAEWKAIQKNFFENGMRRMDEERTKWFIEVIIDHLK
ncbi:contact-dependent growth inhibition system immunity protein [Priestia koreensis]|uniref:contact-dependent growth inhibition system immunity protein n=1 Tax=Priestia koreensis TaxID=284581 RepID=UPI003D023741